MHPFYLTDAEISINHLSIKQIFYKSCDTSLGFTLLQLIRCKVRSQNSLSKNKSGIKFYSPAMAKALPLTGLTLHSQET